MDIGVLLFCTILVFWLVIVIIVGVTKEFDKELQNGRREKAKKENQAKTDNNESADKITDVNNQITSVSLENITITEINTVLTKITTCNYISEWFLEKILKSSIKTTKMLEFLQRKNLIQLTDHAGWKLNTLAIEEYLKNLLQIKETINLLKKINSLELSQINKLSEERMQRGKDINSQSHTEENMNKKIEQTTNGHPVAAIFIFILFLGFLFAVKANSNSRREKLQQQYLQRQELQQQLGKLENLLLEQEKTSCRASRQIFKKDRSSLAKAMMKVNCEGSWEDWHISELKNNVYVVSKKYTHKDLQGYTQVDKFTFQVYLVSKIIVGLNYSSCGLLFPERAMQIIREENSFASPRYARECRGGFL